MFDLFPLQEVPHSVLPVDVPLADATGDNYPNPPKPTK